MKNTAKVFDGTNWEHPTTTEDRFVNASEDTLKKRAQYNNKTGRAATRRLNKLGGV